jgi:hypothetical protein
MSIASLAVVTKRKADAPDGFGGAHGFIHDVRANY